MSHYRDVQYHSLPPKSSIQHQPLTSAIQYDCSPGPLIPMLHIILFHDLASVFTNTIEKPQNNSSVSLDSMPVPPPCSPGFCSGISFCIPVFAFTNKIHGLQNNLPVLPIFSSSFTPAILFCGSVALFPEHPSPTKPSRSMNLHEKRSIKFINHTLFHLFHFSFSIRPITRRDSPPLIARNSLKGTALALALSGR
jgi:hypothetical protein